MFNPFKNVPVQDQSSVDISGGEVDPDLLVITEKTPVKASAATMTVTNKVKGTVGNATAIAEGLADGSWALGATFLGGGVDGTLGHANELCADGSFLYHCIAANTAADTNWRRITLGTAY